MAKTLKLCFTGSIVLTPEYPWPLHDIGGPLIGVMRGGRHRRRSTFPADQVDAQFAFLDFDYPQIVLGATDARDADYKYPTPSTVKKGLIFFEREQLQVMTPPRDVQLTFDGSDASVPPTTSSTATRYIARWSDFAGGGNPGLKQEVLTRDDDWTRIVIPAGKVSSRFVDPRIASIDFDYGNTPVSKKYAQEIVVTLTYDDSTPNVILRSFPFDPHAESTSLTFTWHDKDDIVLLFGNGTLEAILSVLSGSFAGEDHVGDYDKDFEILYDIMKVDPDHLGRLPLPKITSVETSRIPCIATMTPVSNDGTLAATDVRRQPRERRTK